MHVSHFHHLLHFEGQNDEMQISLGPLQSRDSQVQFYSVLQLIRMLHCKIFPHYFHATTTWYDFAPI